MALIYFFPRSLQHIEVGVLWIAFLGLAGAIVADRLVEFEKDRTDDTKAPDLGAVRDN